MLPRLLTALALGTVMALGLWLRGRTFMGVVGPDNVDYVTIAHSLARGNQLYAHDLYPFHVGRLTLVVPLALSFALFGPGERVSAIWPALCSLGSALVAYGLGRRLAGQIAGLVAALFVATYPLEVVYSTTPLPDTAVAFFLGLSTWAFLGALDRAGRGAMLLYGLSGVALGLAYYARVNAPVLVGFFALWLWLTRRRPVPEMGCFALGVGAVLALGSALVVFRGGSPWFEIAQFRRLAASNAGVVAERGGLYPLGHFADVLLFGPMFRQWTVLVAASLIGLIARRDRRLALPLLWFTVLYLYLEVLSQYPWVSLVEKEERYLTPLVLPMALTVALAGAALWRAIGTGARRGALGLAVLAVAGLLLEPTHAAAQRFVAHQRTLESWGPREAAAVLATLPPAPVYVTADWVRYLNFFGRFSFGLDPADPSTFATSRLQKARLADGSRPIEVGPGYVVHDEQFGLATPPDWRLLHRFPPGVSVYFAPAPTRRDDGRYEMRLGLDVPVGPALRVVGVGAAGEPEGDVLSVAVDWAPAAGLGEESVVVSVHDASGAARAAARAPLGGEQGVPSGLWTAGSVYRAYYDLAAAGAAAGGLELRVALGDAPPVGLGRLAPPAPPRLLEAEEFAGVVPDQDRSLQYLVGWGSYSQPSYSGGKAAVARLPGARVRRTVESGGEQRLWLRVFSYGPAANRLHVALGDRSGVVSWRSGAPGLGWVGLGLPGPRGVAELELTSLEVGQPYLIVDAVGFEIR